LVAKGSFPERCPEIMRGTDRLLGAVVGVVAERRANMALHLNCSDKAAIHLAACVVADVTLGL